MILSVKPGSHIWLAVLVITVMAIFYASSPQASAFTPTVESVRIGVSPTGPNVAPITLVAGSSKSYYINGTISDLDTFEDITSVNVTLYRSGVGSSCTADNNNCYVAPSCTFWETSGTTVDYSCQVDLQYYTDYTDSDVYASETWNVTFNIDGFILNPGYTNEVSSLVSVNIPGAIAYGFLTLGSTSASVPLTLTNYGNHAADVQIYSTANMSCSTGFIPISSQKWDLSDIDYGSMVYTLNATPTNAGVSLPQQTNDFSPVTANIYFRLSVPSSAVGGTCTGNTYVDAVSS